MLLRTTDTLSDILNPSHLRLTKEGISDSIGFEYYAAAESLTLKLVDIHRETGIHSKIISRIKNHPFDNCATEHLGKLVEFFFHRLRIKEGVETVEEEKQLMNRILCDLISIYPDAPSYWKGIEDEFRTPENAPPFKLLWNMRKTVKREQ